jgi:stage II sporulation protein D
MAPRAEEPWITVALAWDLRGVTIDPEGAAVVEGAGRHALAAGEQLAVTLEGGRAVARGLAGRVRWRAAASPGETLWVTSEAGAVFRWNGRRWRGQFKIFINPRRKLTLATRLTLESYLVGVVPGEIGALAEGLLEAGRAQAIAARSYTLYYRGRRGAEGFDLYGTVEDQVYGPVETERPLATRCVESTAGKVALSAGQPIRANYCSTCGGITADVWEAWPAAPLPYLVSHRDGGGPAGEATTPDYCAASPHYRWREEWPAAEFVANLARFGPGLGVPLPHGGAGRLVDVRVDARARSGRVWRLRVETTAGELIVPAWSLRQVLRRPGNAVAILRSNLFKVDVRRDPSTGHVLAVVVSGAGSGHGVGLCQTGALGMAREGRAADDIIRHYYRGVEIRRLY